MPPSARRPTGRRRARSAGRSALDGVPRALPALMRAHKLSKRAARVGFDFEHPSQTADKVAEELAEVREAAGPPQAGPRQQNASGASPEIFEEIGDLLFAAANLARKLDVDAEAALRAANAKFERRFRAMEELGRARGAEILELEPRGAGGAVAGRETCRMRQPAQTPVPLVFKHDPDLPIFARRQDILEALRAPPGPDRRRRHRLGQEHAAARNIAWSSGAGPDAGGAG